MNNLSNVFAIQDIIKDNSPPAYMPVRHHFGPGVYIREIFMKAGLFVVGKMHKTEHFNEVIAGQVRLLDPDTGEITEHIAGDIFLSKPGVKKVLYIVEDCVWRTIHVTNTIDMKLLEAELIVPEESLRNDSGDLLLEDTALQKLLGEN